MAASGLKKGEVVSSLEALAEMGKLREKRSDWDYHVRASFHVLDDYVRRTVDGYDELVVTIAAQIVNEGLKSDEDLAEVVQRTRPLVRHVLESFQGRNLISTVSTDDQSVYVKRHGELLKRLLS